jgi:hypothetical protein
MSRVRKDTPIWDKALPLMAAAAAPNLTAVSLVEVARDSQSAAFAFIARLPHLTDLALDFASPLHVPGRHTFSLASLRTLHAPPSVANHLLSRAESFRALQSLALVWNSTPDAPLLVLIVPMRSVTTLRARGLAPHVALAVHSTATSPAIAHVLTHVTVNQRMLPGGAEGIRRRAVRRWSRSRHRSRPLGAEDQRDGDGGRRALKVIEVDGTSCEL